MSASTSQLISSALAPSAWVKDYEGLAGAAWMENIPPLIDTGWMQDLPGLTGAGSITGNLFTDAQMQAEPSPVLCRSYAGASTGWDGVSRSA